jgi:hypothetical protein
MHGGDGGGGLIIDHMAALTHVAPADCRHGLLSEGDGNSTTLAKCPRDFVEAPSQMLENW